MLIITCKKLYQQGIWTGSKMTFRHFGYFIEFRNYVLVHRAFFKLYTNISTGCITQDFWVYMIARSRNNFIFYHSLYTLMYGSTRNTALLGYISEWNTCILSNNFQNLPV